MARIVMPLASDFEDVEFTVPRDRLERAGHEVVVLGTEQGEELEGKRGEATVRADATVDGLDPAEFDALVIPGGYSPDKLRMDADIVDFVKRFARTGKLVAAICHGPSLLIDADAVRGRNLTSWPSVRRDLENAGARWVDREVVVDTNLVTSRKPDDLEVFCNTIEGRLVAATTPG